MTTTANNITKDMTPAEAANLLATLQQGGQAAWRSIHEVPWHSAEHESRLQTASEVDRVFLAVMRETIDSGLRQRGETGQEFAERAASEASQLDTRDAGPTADPVNLAGGKNETGIALPADPSTPEGRAYGRAFSDAAAARVKELRQRNPLPEPDRTPGAPHPDPFLAARGWHAGKHGVYVRKPGPQAAPRPDKELEAG